MLRALQRHPDSPSQAVRGLQVEIAREAQARLVLNYRLTGELSRLVLPNEEPPRRADELWRSTCFEAFVRDRGADAYTEINLAPQGAWAVYGFDAYREGMHSPGAAAPRLATARRAGGYELRAVVDLAGLASAEARWTVAISAVIEDADGSKSYWALAHPAGKPDFHHADGFVLDLPAP